MSAPIGVELPLVSFVIPCFNSRRYLARSLDSIIAERREYYPNLEIIVIDGGSTDGTVEVIQGYEPELACWISEPDQGPADAFNKGWRKARGEFIRYMAADDEILPGKTATLVQAMCANPSAGVVGGSFVTAGADEADGYTESVPRLARGRVRRLHLMLWGVAPGLTPEACLFKRQVLADLGGWPLRYRYACDLDFWFHVIDAGSRIIGLDDPVLRKRLQADAVTVRFSERVGRETQALLRERAGILFALLYKARYHPGLRHAAEAPLKAFGLHPLRAIRKVRGWFSADA